MELDMQLTAAETQKETLSLLVNLLAKTEASAYTIIHLIANGDEALKTKYFKAFDDESIARRELIINYLYAEYGDMSNFFR
jgi:hypothetical protein